MGFLIIYIIFIFIELIFAGSFMIFTISLLYSSIKGSPYVSTRTREVQVILGGYPIPKNSYFIEIGCGDGRIVRTAVKDYQCKGLGIDVNPVLTFCARLIAKFKKIQNLTFRTQNMFDPLFEKDLQKADAIYLFLMPKIIEKLAPVLQKHCKKNTLVISHGFKFENWSKKLAKKIDRHPFPTYYYRI